MKKPAPAVDFLEAGGMAFCRDWLRFARANLLAGADPFNSDAAHRQVRRFAAYLADLNERNAARMQNIAPEGDETEPTTSISSKTVNTLATLRSS